MKKLLFGAFLVTLVAATPARAQGDRPVHLNIGGGFTMPVSDVSERFGTGGGFNIGVDLRAATRRCRHPGRIRVQRPRRRRRRRSRSSPRPSRRCSPDEALIESHHTMHYVNFNGISADAGRPALFKPYAIGGTGMYYRSREPDDARRRVHHVLRSLLVRLLSDAPSRSTRSSAIARRGIPASTSAAASRFALGEAALFYVETRWHYMWGPEFTDGDGVIQNANGQYLPVTFGFRF